MLGLSDVFRDRAAKRRQATLAGTEGFVKLETPLLRAV